MATFSSKFSPKIRLVGLVLLVTILSSGQLVQSDIFDSMGKIINGVASFPCLISHGSEFDACYKEIGAVYQSLDYEHAEDHKIKDACCAYVAYRDCVRMVATRRCGDQSSEAANSFLNVIKGASLTCTRYESLLDCMDPALMLGCVALGVAILLCCCCACCSAKRRRRQQSALYV